MERYIDMKSPLTGGRVKEVTTVEDKEFRKEQYRVHVRYCVCQDTGQQFTTTEQDTLQFNDLYSQYRLKHGIPFADEIKEIRQQYGLNYSQISRILGFGINQYARYENGEVPSESNGKMIAAIRQKEVMMRMLEGCRDSFSASEYQKILSSITLSQLKEPECSSLHKVIYSDISRNIFNGYGCQSIPKLFGMVTYAIAQHGEIFPTKLNKLLFYADFSHYRKTGMSISGLKYMALPFGPVPAHYATVYDNAPVIEKRPVEAHGMVSTLLSCRAASEYPNLSTAEKESIDRVVYKLQPMSVAQVIEASHQEPCWRLYADIRAEIPYDEAFGLRLL